MSDNDILLPTYPSTKQSVSVIVQGVGNIRVSGAGWSAAITEDSIIRSIAWSLCFSAICATVTVLIFSGSFIVSVIAAFTLAAINIWMLGFYRMISWKLGAIEGISITMLMYAAP